MGVGNPLRRDDGAGRVVARRLVFPDSERVRVSGQSGEGTALLEAWKGSQWVYLIDAVRSGARPGTVHRLDARQQAIPGGFFHYSSHAFGVAEAVELARALDELPARLILYGIEGKDFSAGETLSCEVAAAVENVVRQIQGELCASVPEGSGAEGQARTGRPRVGLSDCP